MTDSNKDQKKNNRQGNKNNTGHPDEKEKLQRPPVFENDNLTTTE